MSTVTRVLAPNPSALTLDGTNSWLVDDGRGHAICIDPGPPVPRHIDAIVAAACERDARIDAILVTHGHPDHWPGAPMLAEVTGAPIYAHHRAEFAHDRAMHEGDCARFGDLALRAIDAPGHTFDSLVFYDERDPALFTGDVVLGQGTVAIAPPSGSMRAYQRTLQRLANTFHEARAIYGGHGPRVDDAQAKLREYIEHRRKRESELLLALSLQPQTIPDLVRRIYADVRPLLWPAAARQMLAYLQPLEHEGRVRSRALDRAPDAAENAILNPEWSNIVGHEHAALVEAELGTMLHLDTVREYELTR
ncbi:MAG: MBL fold metallo-hydrolase [Candidatus Eremiobacteraeota bacterium]|nr:MBL fold metallo-hydrolase [Candidatus Eremiobacteraeota bacterium]